MKQFKLLITFCISLLGVISCNPQPEADRLLRLAQEVVETDPDSAMNLIDSIYYPENSLSHERYMEFLVTRTQSKHKVYRPINEDTIVFKARDYFEKRNNNPEMTALAWYYSGCVYREKQYYDQAMQHYKKAEQLASQSNNINLSGLVEYNIGDLLFSQGYHQQALTHYRNAANIYTHLQEGFHKSLAHSLGAMGRMYLLLKQPDSAFIYFQKGLDITDNAQDTKLQSQLLQNMSVMYKENGDFEKHEFYLKKSYLLNQDSTELPRYYLNFAQMYLGMNQPDSVSLYVKLIEQEIAIIDDDYLKASIFSFLANREKDLLNFDAAFDYQDNLSSVIANILSKRLEQSVYETNIKYDYSQAQNKMLKSQMSTRTLFGVVGLLFIILVMVLLIWRSQKKTASLEKVYTESKLLLSQQKTEEKQRIISVALPYLNLHSSIQNQLLEFASKVRGKDKKLGDALDELLKGNRSAFNDTTQQIFTDELMHDVVGISKGLELLNPSDRLLILMLAIDVDNNNIAALLNTTPMNLKSKKSYLKKKLQNNADQFDNYDFLISIF